TGPHERPHAPAALTGAASALLQHPDAVIGARGSAAVLEHTVLLTEGVDLSVVGGDDVVRDDEGRRVVDLPHVRDHTFARGRAGALDGVEVPRERALDRRALPSTAARRDGDG